MVILGFIFIVLLSLGAIGIWLLITFELLLYIPVLLIILVQKVYTNQYLTTICVFILKLKQSYVNILGGLFLDYLSILLIHLCNIKIFIYNNKSNQVINRESIGIIISNHRTRVDWLFVGFCYNYIINNNHHIFIILKDSLRSIPFYGWAIQMMQYIFLSRDKSTDLSYISQNIDYLSETINNPTILVFPEGTDLSESNVDKCRAYCESKGLTVFSQVLYPKSLGLGVCLDSLRGKELYLQDLTIAYKDYQPNTRCSESAILKGEFPQEVHIFVDQYAIDEIPSEKSQLYKWLLDRFAKKDEVLRDYYNSSHFLSYVRDKYLDPTIYPTIKLIQTILSLIAVIAIYLVLLSNEWIAVILGVWFIVVSIASLLVTSCLTGWDFINLQLYDAVNKNKDTTVYSAI